MAKLPKGHVEVGSGLASNNHYPGRPYHHVRAIVSRRGSTYRCRVLETWGHDQGNHLEEHGRSEVIARGLSVEDVTHSTKQRAKEAGIDGAMLAQALSIAADESSEQELDVAEGRKA